MIVPQNVKLARVAIGRCYSKGAHLGQQERPAPTDAGLDEMQWIADPHADDTVAAILGPWPAPAPRAGLLAASAEAATADPETEARLKRIDELNATLRTWQDNAGVASLTDLLRTSPYIDDEQRAYWLALLPALDGPLRLQLVSAARRCTGS